MNQEASVRRLGWGLTAVGVVLAAIAGFLALNTAGTESWVEVEGVVVDVDKEDGVVIGTTIRYRDAEDNAYDLPSDYGTEDSRRGEKVMIQYDPTNPNDALLAGESTGASIHWWFVLVFGLMAVWGVVVALFDPQLSEVRTGAREPVVDRTPEPGRARELDDDARRALGIGSAQHVVEAVRDRGEIGSGAESDEAPARGQGGFVAVVAEVDDVVGPRTGGVEAGDHGDGRGAGGVVALVVTG